MKKEIALVLNTKILFHKLSLFTLLVLLPVILLAVIHARTAFGASQNVEIWWPQNNSTISGTQPFKAVLTDTSTDAYSMYWQVDGGTLVPMDTSTADYPHKEATVDISPWTWRENKTYQVTIVAKDSSGTTLGEKTISIINEGQQDAPAVVNTPTVTPQKSVSIWWPSANAQIQGQQTFKSVLDDMTVDQYKMFLSIDGAAKKEMQTSTIDHPHKMVAVDVSSLSSQTAHEATFTATDLAGNKIGEKTVSFTNSAPTQVAVVPPPPVITSQGNPFAGEKFYVNPYSNAKRQITQWLTSRPQDALQLNKIADRPDAEWFGNWNSNIMQDIRAYITKVQAQNNSLPVIVAYNIPQRDCGGYSAGGSNDPASYKTWIRALAQGIGAAKAVVILEPDALSSMDCLNTADKDTRLSLLKDAVEVLKAAGNIAVYIDAGHSNWNSAQETATRLLKAGIAQANGFSLNISNFIATSNNITFGSAVSALTGGKHFVIDTSRNGNGSNGEWCNPSGRALGSAPTANTGNTLVDAFFWIKKPGDSDGTCNGAPNAGEWMPEYALELARNA
jgi:endoglucanase